MNVEHYTMVARHIAARQAAAVVATRYQLLARQARSRGWHDVAECANTISRTEYNLYSNSFSLDNLLTHTARFDRFRHGK